MKTIVQKVNAVKRVYAQLDKKIDALQKESGLHCPSGCGQCCKKPDIECTPVEFLPMALDWLDEGVLWEKYEEIKNQESSLCFVYRPSVTSFGGLCNNYPNRGLICRLFGYSARMNKEGKKEMVTCKILKEEQAPALEFIAAHPKTMPVMTNYSTKMASIDLQLNTRMPINQAIIQAIETVGAYYAYRSRRKPKK
jgi:Fe-S-cluster containining protein